MRYFPRIRWRSAVLQGTVFAAVFMTFCIGIPAEEHTAMLMGTIFDPSGASVRDVRVILLGENTEIRRYSITNETGYFVIPELVAGSYTLQAYGPGFKPFQVTHIVLATGDRRDLEIHFKLRPDRAVVTVYGNGKEGEGSVATTIDPQLVQDLPVLGRSFPSLFLLTPGIVMMPAQQALSNDREFSFNGQSTNANYFTVDGVSVNTAVGVDGDQLDLGQGVGYGVAGTSMNVLPADAVREIEIQTATLSPMFGRQAGGQIQLTSRSGTGQFHGAVSEYFRNSALDAADWFSNRDDSSKPQLRQHDFGGSLGGPFRVPFAGVRDRSFFFFAYEGLRSLQPTSFETDVPSLSLRKQAPLALQPYLKVFPVPSGPEDPDSRTASYTVSNSSPASASAYNLRLDHTSGSQMAFFLRYSYSPSLATSSTTGWNLSTSESRSQSVTVGATWTPNAHLTNTFRGNYSKDVGSTKSGLLNRDGPNAPSEDVLLPNRSWAGKSYSATYNFMDSSYTVATPAANAVRQINIVNNTTFAVGRHTTIMGVDGLSLLGDTRPNSTALFVNYLSPQSVQSGNADYLAIESQDGIQLVQHSLSLYIRDVWHPNNRMAFDYGIRWELNPAPHALNGQHLYTVVSGNDLALADPRAPLYRTRYTDIAPRIGISYLLNQSAGHELLLRVGAGINYSLGNTSSMSLTSAFPHVRQFGASNVVFPQAATNLPSPPSPKLTPPFDGQSFYGYSSNYAAPKVYQWSIGIEQSLTPDQNLSLTYVGSIGRRLFVKQAFVDPNSNFIHDSLVSINRSDAVSDYNALQVQYKRRLSRGLQALASYTWARSRDDASRDLPVLSTPYLTDLKTEYGPSAFDLRNSFGAALTYEVPVVAERRWIRTALGHWGLSTFVLARGGMPVDVTYGTWIANQLFPMRPNRVPGQPLYLPQSSTPKGNILNPNAFIISGESQQGTLERNSIRGFSFWQADLGVSRTFQVADKVQLQWRAEFFNMFNHPNFGDPNSNLGEVDDGELFADPSFGQITSMLNTSLGGSGAQKQFQIGGARSIQFALKLSF